MKFLVQVLLPPGGPALGTLLGVALAWTGHPTGMLLVALSGLVLYLSSTLPVSRALCHALEDHPAIPPEQIPRLQADAIVVLSAGFLSNSPEYGVVSPNYASAARLRYGAFLQKATGLPLVVTGDLETVQAAEQFLGELGVQPEYPWVASHTTWEEAMSCVPYLRQRGYQRILLVTSAGHMARALRSFSGVQVQPAPTSFTPNHDVGWRRWLPSALRLAGTNMALLEWLSRLGYRLLGRG